MTPYESKFERILLKELLSRKQELLEEMGAGVTEAQYRTLVGWVKGLDDCIEIMDETRKKMDE